MSQDPHDKDARVLTTLSFLHFNHQYKSSYIPVPPCLRSCYILPGRDAMRRSRTLKNIDFTPSRRNRVYKPNHHYPRSHSLPLHFNTIAIRREVHLTKALPDSTNCSTPHLEQKRQRLDLAFIQDIGLGH